MDAFIVLHGLMLLTCHKTTQTCSVLIADTPTHKYTIGTPGNMAPLPSSPNGPFTSRNLSASGPNKDPFGALTPSPLKSRSFVLDGTKATEVEANAKYVFHIAIPDEVWAAGYASLDTKTALANPTPDNFESNVSGATFDIPETMILRYKGVSADFSLSDGISTFSSAPVTDAASAVLSYVLVITSWPDCSGKGHSSASFNKMLKIGGTVPGWKLTETLGYADGDDPMLGQLKLPNSIVAMPSCLSALSGHAAHTASAKKSRSKKSGAQNSNKQYIFNADATGCGVVSNDGN